METKVDIRKRVLKKRMELSQKEWEEKSKKITEKLISHPYFLEAEEIYCYVDFRKEVSTKQIIETAWNLHKKVAVPKTEEDMKHIMNSIKRIEVEEELADVLFSVLRFAQMNCIDLTSALMKKLEKNEKKYPVEKAYGKSTKYDKL